MQTDITFILEPEEMSRKINILKDYNTKNRKIEYSIVLPCMLIREREDLKKITKKLKKEKMTVEFKKSIAGGLTVGTIDDIINGISKYVNIGVSHFIFHFLILDQSVLKKFSRVMKISKTLR